MRLKQSLKYLFLTLLLGGNAAFAQDYNHYQAVGCAGEIPEDFLLSVKEKQAEHRGFKDSVTAGGGKFLTETNFGINQLLLSGKVLFNDPWSEYARDIAAVLLADQPELLDELRFYTVRAPEVNAFASNDGTIFINHGLFAKAGNEAEIAFILAHEINHYLENHVWQIFVKESALQSGAPGRVTVENDFFATEKFSRGMELEADSLGALLFLRSPYHYIAADAAMDMLHYSDLPHDRAAFDTETLLEYGLELPEKYVFDGDLEVEERDEDWDDGRSTHPNILTRRAQVKRIVSNNTAVLDAPFFIVSADRFYRLQKMARFEVVQHLFKEARYEEAIHEASLLQKIEPESAFLREIIGRSLYVLARYANDRSVYDAVHVPYRRVEGGQIPINYLIHRLKEQELNILAFLYLQKTSETNQRPEVMRPRADLIQDLYRHHEPLMADIARHRNKEQPDSTDAENSFSSSAFRQTLYDVLEADSALWEEFKEQEAIVEEESVVRAESWMAMRRVRKGKDHLGIDKLMVLDPVYYSGDEREENWMLYQDTEDRKQRFEDLMEENAAEMDVEAGLLAPNRLEAGDVDRFNDMMVMKNFFQEYFAHDGKQLRIYDYSELQRISHKYGTPYFSWIGAMSTRRFKNGRDYARLGLTVVAFPLLPYGIYRMVTPSYETNLFSMVYDVEADEVMLVDYRFFSRDDKDKLLDRELNRLFKQVGNGQK